MEQVPDPRPDRKCAAIRLALACVWLVLASGPAAAAGWLDGWLWTSSRPQKARLEPDWHAILMAQLARLPASDAGTIAIAGHAGGEGHWTFLNRRGETFTVGAPAEMQRLVPALAPEARPGAALALYLSLASVTERAAMLAELPAGAALHVVVDERALPLVRAGTARAAVWRALLRPRVQLELADHGLVAEALAQLSRPLDRRKVRLLSLEPDGPPQIARMPRLDGASGRAMPDPVDPYKLASALPALAGQTAVISGRISGTQLVFRLRNGTELTLLHDDLTSAAARAGVDLLIVQSATPHQPGTRNWLWQQFAIENLDKALSDATLADTLATLASTRDPLVVSISEGEAGRVRLKAGPEPGSAAPGEGLGGLWREVTAGVTGSLAAHAVEAHLASAAQRRELAWRLVPGVPALAQAGYLALLALGIAALGTARRWWQRIWPQELRGDYDGFAGFAAARIARLAAFGLLFLPLVSIPALVATIAALLRRLAWGGRGAGGQADAAGTAGKTG